MTAAVDQEWITEQLDALAAISSEVAPAVTRIVFSEADLRARDFVKGLCREAGLEIREDAVGNTFARWRGSEPALTAVATGSHIDAIPNAGRYDGTVGVLGALEAIRALARSGFRPKRSIELIVFTSEEPTRFGIGCLGSRLMSGTLDAGAAAELRDYDGNTLDDARATAGFRGPLDGVRMDANSYSAFVELHIEQGPLLERENLLVGVVTAIAAPASVRLTLEGEGGHAGAVLMPDRRDAFLAAAEISLAVERAALRTESRDTVGTIGICRVFPGAINSIPSKVELGIDVRDIDGERRNSALGEIEKASVEICKRRRIHRTWELLNADSPAICSPEIVRALTDSCAACHVQGKEMISRAYHDSLFMARIAPTAMLFVPCRGGVSHRPDEYAAPEAIAAGTHVLAGALARLSHAG
jgi:N-carbamoyl-L-amino-acid hydrolase